jgi:hypothetical protein
MYSRLMRANGLGVLNIRCRIMLSRRPSRVHCPRIHGFEQASHRMPRQQCMAPSATAGRTKPVLRLDVDPSNTALKIPAAHAIAHIMFSGAWLPRVSFFLLLSSTAFRGRDLAIASWLVGGNSAYLLLLCFCQCPEPSNARNQRRSRRAASSGLFHQVQGKWKHELVIYNRPLLCICWGQPGDWKGGFEGVRGTIR